MHYDADVIIAGAGPAGTLAAYELARRGMDAMILERSPFPRYKVCGGGLTSKVLKEIPYDISPVIETGIFSVRFSRHFSDAFTRTSPDRLILCTMRDRLDEYMLNRALEAGARVIHGQHVSEHIQEADCIIVKSRTESFRSKFLIGADGASSAVAYGSGLRRDLMPGFAWEAEMECDPQDLEQYGNVVFLDWGTFPGGYGWIFPKGDHFSVGVGGPASLSRYLKSYAEGFINASGIRFTRTRSLKAWPIPVRIRKGVFHSGRVLVAGDAAGLADPLTGEGILYAVRSAALAAQAVSGCIEGRNEDLTSYSVSVNREIMPELIEANRIKAVFNALPARIHRLVAEQDRVWGAFCKILKGERTYADVRTGFGRWEFMWETVCCLCERKSKYRERRFRWP